MFSEPGWYTVRAVYMDENDELKVDYNAVCATSEEELKREVLAHMCIIEKYSKKVHEVTTKFTRNKYDRYY